MSTDDQMSMEDRVRTATLAGASLIRDVRPLGAPGPVRLRRRPGPAPRRWVSWGGPLAAAAAVVAIALTLVAVRQPGTPSPAASGTGTAAPATIPRYYVSVTQVATGAHTGHSGPLLVGDDRTGKVIATVAPPPGLVIADVRGTADDRTFVVEDAVSTTPTRLSYTWYRLRVTPGSAHQYQLTKVPVTLPDKGSILPYALSPDGRELAVETIGRTGGRTVITLGIYSVSTGAQLHAWTAPAQFASEGAGALSWPSGGRQLVFLANAGSARDLQLRTLDITGTGTDLVADSRVLLTLDNADMSACGFPRITPGGRTVICDTVVGAPGADESGACANGALKFIAFPIPAQRRPGRVLYQYPGGCHHGATFTLWADASASSIIGVTEIGTAAPGVNEAFAIGVITGGRFRPLNIAKSIPPGDYAALAF